MVKQISDYVAEVQQKFPILSKSEINKILTYGLKMYVYAHKNHCDVKVHNLTDESVMMHCGRLTLDTLKHYKYWCLKWRMKERVLFKLRGDKWDGYYYIGLTQTQHDRITKKGKQVHFKEVYLTKLKKELYHNKVVKHIWRIPYPMDCGWKFFVKDLKSEHAEYIGENQYERYHQCFLGRFNDGPAPIVNKTTSTD